MRKCTFHSYSSRFFCYNCIGTSISFGFKKNKNLAANKKLNIANNNNNGNSEKEEQQKATIISNHTVINEHNNFIIAGDNNGNSTSTGD